MEFTVIILKCFAWILNNINASILAVICLFCVVLTMGFLKNLVTNGKLTKNSDDQDDDDLLYSSSNSSVPGNIYHTDDE